MKPFRKIYIENGDVLEPYYIFTCEGCGEEIEEAWPMFDDNEGMWCGDCAFIRGKIKEEEYIKDFLFFDHRVKRAAVYNGRIYTTDEAGKFPWEKPKKAERKTPQYAAWRTAVFERDGYRCAICGEVGGRLNAHHIKPFARYPDLRLDVDNGITLCEECHKEVHRKKGKDEADRLDKTT